MYRLSVRGQKVLKGVHLVSAGCWLGGGVSLFILSLAKYLGWIEGEAVYGADLAAHVIDAWVVVNFGALLCFATALLYSLFTNWGFFRHRWIMLKWLVIVLCIGFGIWLGGREEIMLSLSRGLGAESMNSSAYRDALLPYFLGGGVQLCVLALVFAVSIFKPFGKKKKELLQ